MGRPKLCQLILALILVSLIDTPKGTEAQRSLHYLKRDLEYRMRLYQEHHMAVRNIIASSIYAPPANLHLNAPEVRVSSQGNVRFSDLIIPAGALRLSPHIVEPTVHILVNQTKLYADAKATELVQVRQQLDAIVGQLNEPSRQYIYKGQRGEPQPQNNRTHLITGSRLFKQAQYVQLVEAKSISVPRINKTDVSRVVDSTYFRNLTINPFDAQGRLFFEGRKTFWNSVFTRPLRSGCCGRLKPLDTDRLMLRQAAQRVEAPIVIHSLESRRHSSPAIIRQLSAPQLFERSIELVPAGANRPHDLVLRAPTAPPNNFIRLANLISIRQLNQPLVLKKVVFVSPVMIEEAQLANSIVDNRLVLGIESLPQFSFDLAHANYLLKFSNLPRNYTQPIQQVSGALVLDAQVNFLAGIQAPAVNRVNDFGRFVRESLVYTNRPAVIRGPIQFNALPTMWDVVATPGASRRPHDVLIARAMQGLQVGLLNGMRIPQDLVMLPIRPGQLVHVRGPRNFANQVTCLEALGVSGPVNGLLLPAGVIPLHLNDFMGSTAYSNLWFLDGLSALHMTVEAGQFDDIRLRDVNGDAQSIILNSMTSSQPGGATLIRAPLRVANLHLINGPGRDGQPVGQLNGFRPQEVMELNQRYRFDTLYGRKRFLAPVRASECIFREINQLANWTNHLIRIDRPNTVQTVHTKLLFAGQPTPSAPTELNVDRLDVEFQQEASAAHYKQNWNFSPEFYLLHQALMRGTANYTHARYRVLNQLQLVHPSGGRVNNVLLSDVLRTDQSFRFGGTFTMVGKVEIHNSLSADRVQSNYPLDAMDLVQFDKYRIPIVGNTRAPIRLNNLLLGQENRASFVQCRLLNGTPLNEFFDSIMSLTRPQTVAGPLVFQSPVSFEGMFRTRSALNGIKAFNQFAQRLKTAQYTFEDGLQCNAVLVRT